MINRIATTVFGLLVVLVGALLAATFGHEVGAYNHTDYLLASIALANILWGAKLIWRP